MRRLLVLLENVKFVPVEKDGQNYLFQVDSRKYLDITTEERFQKVAFSILKGRFGTPNEKYRLEKPTRPSPCSVAKTTWDAMTEDDPDYEDTREIILESTNAVRIYENALREYEAIVACLVEEDAVLAPALLEARKSFPNEGYLIVSLWDEYEV